MIIIQLQNFLNRIDNIPSIKKKLVFGCLHQFVFYAIIFIHSLHQSCYYITEECKIMGLSVFIQTATRALTLFTNIFNLHNIPHFLHSPIKPSTLLTFALQDIHPRYAWLKGLDQVYYMDPASNDSSAQSWSLALA